MRPESSRPTLNHGKETAPFSREMSVSTADTTQQAIARQLGQAMQAARMPPPGDQGSDPRPAELMDAAQQEMLLSQDAMVATRAHARAHAAMEAARRIADGTYGICQACGERIPPRRLLAVPLTRFCLPCQDLREQRRRNRYRLDVNEGDRWLQSS